MLCRLRIVSLKNSFISSRIFISSNNRLKKIQHHTIIFKCLLFENSLQFLPSLWVRKSMIVVPLANRFTVTRLLSPRLSGIESHVFSSGVRILVKKFLYLLQKSEEELPFVHRERDILCSGLHPIAQPDPPFALEYSVADRYILSA